MRWGGLIDVHPMPATKAEVAFIWQLLYAIWSSAYPDVVKAGDTCYGVEAWQEI